MVMAIPPAGNGSVAVEEKEEEEREEEEIKKKHSHENDEVQAQSSEKHFAPPTNQASNQTCPPSSLTSQGLESEQYPSGIRLFIILVAVILSVFLVRVQRPYHIPPALQVTRKSLHRWTLPGSTGYGEFTPRSYLETSLGCRLKKGGRS